MGKTITAVVPVKENSSRLPGKNILPFGNSNLLVHKIEQLKQVEELTDIIVSSDSDIMFTEVMPNEHIMWACVTSPLVAPYPYSNLCRRAA